MYEESLSSFKSYVWGLKPDLIGAGATSLVYKAICLDTGNYVAVKVFNDAAKARSNVLQSRELDLLCKINHENVVKLLDKDESKTSYKYTLRLLVMEYCNGGSLSSILEQPENIYGLQQNEFLLVLKHITCGMNELHKLKIVHRDIKPNNILLQILPTGEHVYKLSDFGAARQVEMEDDQFTSICGTEEYLFPDVYERALINRNLQKSFKAGIDLWSTGVTLYHVAAGVLPFRPIGGRHNRETMIRITKDKPSGCISGIQNAIDGQIEYSDRLPETCQLSKKLQDLLVPMLGGLMETSYEKMWSFQEFFEHSSHIYNLTYINIMNLDTCQIIELPFEKTEKLSDLKRKIAAETNIDQNSQLIIFNNLLLDSLVTQDQAIETYPIIDKQHPLVLFSLTNTLNGDNLEIIKSIPNVKSKFPPKTATEIVLWAKETCGSIYYIKREVYLVTMIIELLKLSAIAFRSYLPEMKLKQQNLLYNFKSTIKSLETKISILDRLNNCADRSNIAGSTFQRLKEKDYLDIKTDLDKFKNEIVLYENEITLLTEKINETKNLEFLVQNSNLTSKWKNQIDAYTNTSQEIYDELYKEKRKLSVKADQDRYQSSKYTEFKINQENKAKEDAVKLYEDVIIVHFYDFYLRFEKWMSDLIKLHNDIMSVQHKLIECEKAMENPIDSIETILDAKIADTLDYLVENFGNLPMTNGQSKKELFMPATPPFSMSSSISAKPSIDSPNSKLSSDTKDDSNHLLNSTNWTSVESLLSSIRDFKDQAVEIEKCLDENANLLKYLHQQFLKTQNYNLKKDLIAAGLTPQATPECNK